MAATSMKFAGKVTEPWARLIVTWRSSSGWRRTSSVGWPNSGSSSRKRTPRCERLISPGRGWGPAADRARLRDGVVGRAEGAPRDKGRIARQEAGDAVDARDHQRLFRRHRGQDGRQGAGEQRLAGAGGADHEQVVAAGGRRPPGAPDGLPAPPPGETP